MKTFILDVIPKLQRFSQKLDNITLLTNQHWVAIDEIENSKYVYIFRSNNELLISHNGKVEKSKWEYLGNNSILIDKKDESYLFKHGFFDENILALKVDSKNEYAFFINENKFSGELNSIQQISNFLTEKYIQPQLPKIETSKSSSEIKTITKPKPSLRYFDTDKGKIEILVEYTFSTPEKGNKAYQNSKAAPNGKYKFGFMWYVHIENGVVVKVTLF
jgi:hypothetical protein